MNEERKSRVSIAPFVKQHILRKLSARAEKSDKKYEWLHKSSNDVKMIQVGDDVVLTKGSDSISIPVRKFNDYIDSLIEKTYQLQKIYDICSRFGDLYKYSGNSSLADRVYNVLQVYDIVRILGVFPQFGMNEEVTIFDGIAEWFQIALLSKKVDGILLIDINRETEKMMEFLVEHVHVFHGGCVVILHTGTKKELRDLIVNHPKARYTYNGEIGVAFFVSKDYWNTICIKMAFEDTLKVVRNAESIEEEV